MFALVASVVALLDGSLPFAAHLLFSLLLFFFFFVMKQSEISGTDRTCCEEQGFILYIFHKENV